MSIVDEVLKEEKEKRKPLSIVDQVLAEAQSTEGMTPFDAAVNAPNAQMGDQSLGLGVNLGLGVLDNPQSEIDLAAKKAFPDMPIEEARQRVGFVDGKLAYLDKNDNLQPVSRGFAEGAARFAGEAGPSIGGGIAGSIIGSPLLGGATGASGGEIARQVLGEVFYGEKETIGEYARRGLTEFGMDLAFGKLFDFAAKLAPTRALRGIDDLDAQKLSQMQDEYFKRTGIRLDLAQLTNSGQLRRLRTFISKEPGKAQEVLQVFDELQQDQVENAISRVINMLSTPGAAKETIGLKGINAAEAVITTAKEARRNATKDLYREAYDEGINVNVRNVISTLDEEMAKAKGPVYKALKAARDLFTVRGTDTIDTSLEGLHQTKVALDALIEGAKKGTESIDSITAGRLQAVRSELIETLEAASPKYAAAQKAYREFSEKYVDPLEDSVIGAIAATSNRNAASVAAKLFKGQLAPSPEAIRTARMAFKRAERNNPELTGAWDGLVAQFLSEAADDAFKETATGTAATVANRFRKAVAPTTNKRMVLKEALGGGAEGASRLKLWDWTIDAIDKVASTPTRASDTASFLAIRDSLQNRLQRFGIFIVSPIGTIKNAMGDATIERALTQSLDAMMDPKKARALQELRMMKPSNERNLIIMGILSGSIALDTTEDFFSPQ